jgi:hypothetical protein
MASGGFAIAAELKEEGFPQRHMESGGFAIAAV